MNISRMRRVAVATIIGSTLCVAPLLASAQATTSSAVSVQLQIQALLTQLKSLQQQLVQLNGAGNASSSMGWMIGTSTHPWMGSTTPPMWGPGMATSTMPMPPHPCPMPTRNLSIGSRGDDVSQLQQFLAQDPSIFPQGLVTGFFGSSTAQAVMRFQKVNDIASTVTGLVGPLTRAFLDNHCGGMNPGGPGMMGSSTRPMPPNMPSIMGSSSRPWMGTTTIRFDDHGMIPPPPPLNANNQGPNPQSQGSGGHW